MLEKDIWPWLKRNTSEDFHWQRIETSTAAGVPDMNACYRPTGLDFWIEGKVIIGKRVMRFRHPLQPLQHAWITKRIHFGGTVKVFALHEDGEWGAVWDGRQSEALLTEGPSAAPSLLLRRPWDKAALIAALTSRS